MTGVAVAGTADVGGNDTVVVAAVVGRDDAAVADAVASGSDDTAVAAAIASSTDNATVAAAVASSADDAAVAAVVWSIDMIKGSGPCNSARVSGSVAKYTGQFRPTHLPWPETQGPR
jgi:hypothetical protein